MLEYNIRTLFQNCNEGFLQHVWVRCTSYYAFGKKGRPVNTFCWDRAQKTLNGLSLVPANGM